MATAGWYPDPSGQPGAFRYWDGTRWSETLADTPYGAPPPGMTPPSPPPPPAPPETAPQAAPATPAPPPPPPPPAGFDQPTLVPGTTGSPSSFESYAAVGPLGPPTPSGYDAVPPPPPASPGNGTGRTVALVLTAIVVTLLIGVATFFVVRAYLDDDEDSSRQSATDGATQEPAPQPTSEPAPETDPPSTETPTEEPSSPPEDGTAPTVAQCTGGLPSDGVTGQQGRLLTGGGLALRLPRGYDGGNDQALAFTFADGVYAPSMLIESGATSSWYAVYALGSLNRANGFDSLQQAAETIGTCMAGSTLFYSDPSGTTVLDSTETEVAGNPAWEHTLEIRIDDPSLSVEGDVAKIVVVDTGDPASYALFVSVVPIGDQAKIDEQDAAVEALQER